MKWKIAMPVTLGAKPDHGFDEPLGLLSDCHRRIERFLGVLLAVCTTRQGGALTADERESLRRAIEYFRVAAPRHTQDEEASLFPRLRASSDPRAAAALAELARLEADHEIADGHHRDVDALVSRWLEAGALAPAAAEELRRLLEALTAIYRAHIAVEDERIFPLAAEVLAAEHLKGIGEEMARRRGLDAAGGAGKLG